MPMKRPKQNTARDDSPVRFRQEQTAEERRAAGRAFRKTAVTLVITAILLAACAVVWLYRDRFSLDGLVLTSDRTSAAREEYIFDAGTGQVFASVGKGLAAATTSGIELIDADGQIAASRLFQMQDPAITACGDRAFYYDLGGTNAAAAFFDGTIKDLTPEGNIYSATLSSGGYLAVTTECAGYRALVTVYDGSLEPVYRWYSSSAWVLSAAVSPDNRQLAVLSYTAAGSEVRFFDLDQTEQKAAFSISDTVLLDVHWLSSSRLCAYSTDQAIFFDAEGQWIGTYSFDGRYLTACTFDCAGCAVFALSRYRAGTTAELVSLDPSCRVLGTAEVQRELLCLSGSGAEVLALCSDQAVLYGSSMSERGRLTGLTGFKYGFLRSRGEAMLVASNYAELYTF